MRKIYSFLVAAVAMFAAASCAQELDNPQAQEEVTVSFEATVDGADTKATLDGITSKWESGDKITIHNGTRGYEFSTTDSGVKAVFSYAGADFSGEKFMAVYPAGTYTADVAAKTVTAVIPDVQPSRDNDFSVGAAPAVAYTEDQNLAFKNASALLKFTVKGQAKGFFFSGNNNEAVAGTVLVTLDEDNKVKTVAAQDASKKSVELWANTSDWYFKEGTTYYAAVVPQNFSKGFTVTLKIDDAGKTVVKKLETAYDLKPNTILDLGELSSTAETEVLNWGVVGTMTDWADGKDLAMTLEEDWYVAKNVTITTEDAFKFRTDGKWGTERTCEGPVAADAEVAVAAGAGDITVAVSAIYDVYLSKAADKMKLVKVGDIEVEEPDPSDEPVASDWGLVGTFNNWSTPDLTLYSYNGMYVAYNVKFDSVTDFKIRKGGVWNDTYNYGLASAGTVSSGKYYTLTAGSGSQNITLGAGTYDIWFDLSKKTLTVVEPGTDPTTAVKGTPVAPLLDTWYLVGTFNNWNTKQEQYKMTAEGDWYVLKGLTLAAKAEVKVCDGTWSVNRGGSFAGVGKACSVTQGGANIVVTTAGTYDVYLNAAATKMYFMTPGSVPAN